MIPPTFDYVKPSTIGETLDALALHGINARVLAGGQSLLPLLKSRSAAPKVLVDIGALHELHRIDQNGESVTIGALTTQAELLEWAVIADRFSHLGIDAWLLGDPMIRNRGTFAGALAFADPAADWTALALVLDVRVRTVSGAGERTMAVDEFLQDSFVTTLGPTELITHLTMMVPADGASLAYRKIPQPGSGLALAGAAVLLDRDTDGLCRECRIAITGMGPRAERARGAERTLEGERLSLDIIERATGRATDELESITDWYATGRYRQRLARACVRRALLDAVGWAS